MMRRRYGVYSPSRRSMASRHARVCLGCYERSWGVPAASISVFRAKRRVSIRHEAKKAHQAIPEELGRGGNR
jgi:hypothetical protein